MRLLVALLFGSLMLVAQDSPDVRTWLNRGVSEYKSARYPEAAAAFRKAVDLDPNNVNARLYLGTVWMTQYIPGAESPENLDLARKAESEFQKVLSLDSSNTTALKSLADIDWMNWYPAWIKARTDSGMLPDETGPLRDAGRRAELRGRYAVILEHAIHNLETALQIDPQYDAAMSRMSLLIRERADLRDSVEEYKQDIAQAGHWFEKAIETGANKIKAQAAQDALRANAPPPPPPSPPERIRVRDTYQQRNLLTKVDPIYPPIAKAARIQGTVRFTAIIGRDGHILNLQLVSGHPLLVESAREAVSQWIYRPTLLNGQPVEVVTLIDVNFSLGLQPPQ